MITLSKQREVENMKNLFINILFFGSIILLLWLGWCFFNYQSRGLKNFKGYTIEEHQQYYYNYISNYPENF